MNKSIAVAVFAYNRPSHLKRVLMSIENSKISNDIYLFIDGPKNYKDKLNQKYIRLQAENFKSKNKFIVVQKKKNFGLAKSIMNGISQLSKKYYAIIVLEDDTVPYKNFFQYMFFCIKNFYNNKDIGAICSFQFSNFTNLRFNQLILLNNFITWGWAIHSKKWQDFLNFKKKNTNKFDLDKTIYKKIWRKTNNRNIWSLNFIKYNILKKKKFIFPSSSLIKNVGFDGSGTNSKLSDKLIVKNENKINKFKKKLIDKKSYQTKHEKKLKKLIDLFY